MALNRYFRDRPLFGFHDDFFRPFTVTDDPFKALMPVIANLDRPDDQVLRVSSPGYEINESDGNYMISVDIPGVKASDVKVDVEDDGKTLHISGGRKVKKEGEMSEMKFEKRFTIGNNIDVDKIKANLSDGVLTLTAPKMEKEKKARTIAITEG